MGGVEDVAFRVNFSGDGAKRLKNRVKEKLQEFMGDYSDDTLVDYVIVLLKNGRRKEEARNELNVFLGDDTDSFVSWLWDHLQSDINLYVQPVESRQNVSAKPKSTFVELGEKTDLQRVNSEPERDKSEKLSKTRRSREWKGLVPESNEPPPLRSAVIASTHMEEDQSVSHVKRSTSPRAAARRKRGRPDERPTVKTEVVPRTKVGASRRLLQFAVRDAISTSKPLGITTEPSLKRLRSVVSSSVDDSVTDVRNQRIKSVATVPNALKVAMKAAAEAARDVVKINPPKNVFDRLSRGADVPDTSDHLVEYREAAVEVDGEYVNMNHHSKEVLPSYHQQHDFSGHYVRNLSRMNSNAVMESESADDDEEYDNNVVQGRRRDPSEMQISIGKEDGDSLMLQYDVDNHVADFVDKPRRDLDQPSGLASTFSVVTPHMNANYGKSTPYQGLRVQDVDNQKIVQERELGVGKSGLQLMKENSNPVAASNGNATPVVELQRDSQKALPSTGLPSTVRPTEDADSRTIFVSNVHFAATKDSLSRHFNKFGEVLKVVILTDAATGQPKGSAYVEFMRKEAAEHALSLDGTSFMSRILKVIRKSSSHQESPPAVTWPRVARASPFASSRYVARVPFPRGMPGMYRSRLPFKPGARSFQWKRDDPSTPSESSTQPPSTRNLTYVRAEPKPTEAA